jgi:hypothetical protein
VVFLRFVPQINAVRQPKHLVVYGLLELMLGLGLAAFEIQVLRRQRRGPAPAGSAPPAAAQPADPWHELGTPLAPEAPDEDIRPS